MLANNKYLSIFKPTQFYISGIENYFKLTFKFLLIVLFNIQAIA